MYSVITTGGHKWSALRITTCTANGNKLKQDKINYTVISFPFKGVTVEKAQSYSWLTTKQNLKRNAYHEKTINRTAKIIVKRKKCCVSQNKNFICH